jgi:undecaprenyl-diphosphatase
MIHRAAQARSSVRAPTIAAMSPRSRRPAWAQELERVDVALYAAVAATPTPALDVAMRRLSAAADHSRLWLVAACALAVGGGSSGRRAAVAGLASVATTSAAVNLVIKPLARRGRPDRDLHGVPLVRHVAMPVTRSFPSGHAASAFAFAGGVGRILPREGIPLHALATAIAYSRVHTGVHFPADTVLGAVIGTVGAQVTSYGMDGRRE